MSERGGGECAFDAIPAYANRRHSQHLLSEPQIIVKTDRPVTMADTRAEFYIAPDWKALGQQGVPDDCGEVIVRPRLVHDSLLCGRSHANIIRVRF
jgi:hypothetical protein